MNSMRLVDRIRQRLRRTSDAEEAARHCIGAHSFISLTQTQHAMKKTYTTEEQNNLSTIPYSTSRLREAPGLLFPGMHLNISDLLTLAPKMFVAGTDPMHQFGRHPFYVPTARWHLVRLYHNRDVKADGFPGRPLRGIEVCFWWLLCQKTGRPLDLKLGEFVLCPLDKHIDGGQLIMSVGHDVYLSRVDTEDSLDQTPVLCTIAPDEIP